MFKKIIYITTLLVFIMSNYIQGCSFHQMLPKGAGSEVIDTLYIEYDIETPEYMIYDEEFITTYIYVIQMEEYIWVENIVARAPGLYLVSSSDVESINQDLENQNIININYKNGETAKIDTVNQENNEMNIFEIVDIDGVSYIDVKKEYMYIYDNEIVETENNFSDESNDEEVNTNSNNTNNPINEIKEYAQEQDEREKEIQEITNSKIDDKNFTDVNYPSQVVLIGICIFIFGTIIVGMMLKIRN